jgi:2-oxoglutarate ferredoxin oxidoreductase subunit beta
MFGLKTQCTLDFQEEYKTLEDYEGKVSRWCPGCGDNGIHSAALRLCRDEQLPPEKTVFVSGIGCASRFPHYMKTYGFHGLHGRAHGDCCSIGTAHWIHAVRMNPNLVAMLHDNNIYGLTKNQVSPTTPIGRRTNTTPYGAFLKPMNPLTVTLGITNVSFVAQVVEWIPDLLYDVIRQAFHHKGFSFIRILQRCPHFMPDLWTSLLSNPDKLLLLEHENGMAIPDSIKQIYKSQEAHDPSDINRAREVAGMEDMVPIGILYRNESVPVYEETRKPARMPTWEQRQKMLEGAFDQSGIFPQKA